MPPRPPAIVTAVDGDELVLISPQGEQRIRLAPTTRVEKQVLAERSELAPGQLVIVSSEPIGDDVVAASVQILGSPPLGPGQASAGSMPMSGTTPSP